MATKSTVFATGRIFWAKILPHQLTQNYDQDGREWTVEFEPDDVSFLKEHKLLDRLKDMSEKAKKLRALGEDDKADKVEKNLVGRKGLYLLLRKPELMKDGDANTPIRIVDSEGEPWDGGELGNGTVVDAKLDIRDWGVGKKKSIYITALRVQDHVPYEKDDFGAMDKAAGKPPKAKEKAPPKKALSELDDEDDLPF